MTPYPLYRRFGGPQGRSGRVRKTFLPDGIRSLARPARSDLLCRLSYPGRQLDRKRDTDSYTESLLFRWPLGFHPLEDCIFLCCDPIPGHSLPLRGFTITLSGHTVLGRAPLDEWSVRRTDPYKEIYIKVVNCTLVPAPRLCAGRTAHRVSRGIALLFHDRGTIRGWGVSVTPRPLFTPRKDPVPIVQEAGWAPVQVWTGAENLVLTGFRSPERPVRSQSLYRLSYPAHKRSI